MDIVTDLSSRAISYLSAYKEICNLLDFKDSTLSFIKVYQNQRNLSADRKNLKNINQADARAAELYPPEPTGSGFDALSELFSITLDIVILVDYHQLNLKLDFEEYKQMVIVDGPRSREENFLLDDLPFEWRVGFRKMLYEKPLIRQICVVVLNYVPLLVVLAMEKKVPKISLVHTLQRYRAVSGGQLTEYWSLRHNRIRGAGLLRSPKKLIAGLNDCNITIPFELLFHDELDEVLKFSDRRYNPQNPDSKPRDPSVRQNPDPLIRAADLRLKGLTFSGGGIRSATFNLGVLQKLAKLGLLREIDYLSTVSGGGYIGTWWVSWIKRLGSFKQVSKLLNPEISGDPLSEEVRPIRWLRMYSNYLSPTTGISSTDTVTIAMTWLRNTLINQFLLILMLCTCLSAIALLFEVWNVSFVKPEWYGPVSLLSISMVFLGVAAFFTGSAMKMFSEGYQKGPDWLSNKFIANFLVIWGAVSGLFISSWLSSGLQRGLIAPPYQPIIIPVVASTAFVAMIAVSIIGKYKESSNSRNDFRYYLWLVISSVCAALLGAYLLTLSRDIIDSVQANPFAEHPSFKRFPKQLSFVIGPPLILESFTLAVIARMLLMGAFFPDERREWWGRMGALIHKFIIGYMLLTFGALILPEMVSVYTQKLLALAGGWLAIVLWAVRMAYTSASATPAAAQGSSRLRQAFIACAPYLFMVGFLLIGSAVLEMFHHYLKLSLPPADLMDWLSYLGFIAALAFLSFIISFRIGVNEFSLHHFYRNRLTRAYLGATRRRTDRENTANDFTGFDAKDEMKIKDFLHDKGYKGPYPILNTAMNASTVSELDRQDRKAESFIFSPLYCGYDFSTTRSAAESRNGIFQYGYRQTHKYAQQDGPGIGTAMAISGAAASPNMGYHSSAPIAFLMTVFNVRLGRWMGNPRLDKYMNSDPGTGLAYLIYDLIGKSDIDKDYVCLSDGGHFDNLGIYELIRRRCSYILVCDAEGDLQTTCEGMANAIRRCRIDFGVDIQLNINKLVSKSPGTGMVSQHIVKGKIWYPGDGDTPSGKIV